MRLKARSVTPVASWWVEVAPQNQGQIHDCDFDVAELGSGPPRWDGPQKEWRHVNGDKA